MMSPEDNALVAHSSRGREMQDLFHLKEISSRLFVFLPPLKLSRPFLLLFIIYYFYSIDSGKEIRY